MPNLLSLGSIEFINSLPVDFGMTSGAVPVDARIVRGIPAALNEKILKGDLDVSPVSAFWYAKHQKEFLLLPELSISSESGVQSVLLFSRYPFAALKGKRIAITEKGRTTPALLEILCRLRYEFSPLISMEKIVDGEIPAGYDAVLLIGDEALSVKARMKKLGLAIIDLAEEWRAWTGTPIVFAVWVARRHSALAFPEKIAELYESIIRSKKWGLSHLDEIIQQAQKQSHLSEEVVKSYFSRLSYELDANLKKGMRLYFDAATQCKLLNQVGPFEEIEMRQPVDSSEEVG